MARILVVDDEEGIRKILKQVLEYEGHAVTAAGGGGEALALFQEVVPDLTLLDVKMARMDAHGCAAKWNRTTKSSARASRFVAWWIESKRLRPLMRACW
jgi:CheY-like chemotaxis protein